MKNVYVSIFVGFIVSVMLIDASSFLNRCKNVRENLIRIHIIANSDSERDQQLKLKVRDRVIDKVAMLCKNVKNKLSAKKILRSHLIDLEKLAVDEVLKNNCSYDVKAELVDMYFNTRRYDNFVLPPGNYDAVRLIIGDGLGKNWWCVAFPPVCAPTKKNLGRLSDVIETSSMQIITENKVEYKFAIVEFVQNIMNYLKVKN